MSANFTSWLTESRRLIGMIHLLGQPGTPQACDINKMIEKSCEEAYELQTHGFDAIIIENMHDAPYIKENIGPEIVASMARAATEIRKIFKGFIGIQVLAAGNKESLSIANACNLDFIRVEGFSYAHVADEGIIEACAGNLLRERARINANKIAILADIKKKHASHNLTKDLTITDWVQGTLFCGADGLIITGDHTGKPPSLNDLKEADSCTNAPILCGSGATNLNIDEIFKFANGIIVGSSIKKKSNWKNAIDPKKCEELINIRDSIKKI